MNEEELKQKLTQEQYKIMRQKGTERPFTGKYVHRGEDGTYGCAACGNPLFNSDAQFYSGTGWPSFDEAIEGSVRYQDDLPAHAGGQAGHGATEIVCATCNSHLGHVFDDLPAPRLPVRGTQAGARQAGGPTKTGKRYCVNSVCLDLKEKK